MADDWSGVRCIFRHGGVGVYEERVTIWQAASVDEAIEMAEAEAGSYGGDIRDAEFLGLSQGFHMFESPGQGAEVFSLIRESEFDPGPYLNRFFDTGGEKQQRASRG